MAIPIPDTRPLFRPLCADIDRLLRSLSAADWDRPTLAPNWRVRDVVAHMLDTALRRLSFHRDGMIPPGPSRPIASDGEFVEFINELNAAWVRAARRLSPRVLIDLYASASARLCDFVEALADDAPAMFPVSWAGDDRSSGLFDIGREFTEVWHHGAQVRDAAGAGPFPDPGWLRAVLAIAVRALAHAYRDVEAVPGVSLQIEVTGPSGGTWTLERQSSTWDLVEGARHDSTARAIMADDAAWRLFFNALPDPQAAVRLSGAPELTRPLLRARSVIV